MAEKKCRKQTLWAGWKEPVHKPTLSKTASKVTSNPKCTQNDSTQLFGELTVFWYEDNEIIVRIPVRTLFQLSQATWQRLPGCITYCLWHAQKSALPGFGLFVSTVTWLGSLLKKVRNSSVMYVYLQCLRAVWVRQKVVKVLHLFFGLNRFQLDRWSSRLRKIRCTFSLANGSQFLQKPIRSSLRELAE